MLVIVILTQGPQGGEDRGLRALFQQLLLGDGGEEGQYFLSGGYITKMDIIILFYKGSLGAGRGRRRREVRHERRSPTGHQPNPRGISCRGPGGRHAIG